MTDERFSVDEDGIDFGDPPEGSEPIRIVPPPDDPMAVARVFLKDAYTREDDVLLRHHRFPPLDWLRSRRWA